MGKKPGTAGAGYNQEAKSISHRHHNISIDKTSKSGRTKRSDKKTAVLNRSVNTKTAMSGKWPGDWLCGIALRCGTARRKSAGDGKAARVGLECRKCLKYRKNSYR
jgi:hypothetical protein